VKKLLAGLLLFLSFPVNAESEVECLAKNIYFEARNQPWVGRLAIANVTINRKESKRFPSTVCKVVKQRSKNNICQFSWYCDGKSDVPYDLATYNKARDIAMFVLPGKFPDVTEGALWYHASYIKPPVWSKDYIKTVVINDHIFYKE